MLELLAASVVLLAAPAPAVDAPIKIGGMPPLMPITAADYAKDKHPREGDSNPTRVVSPFWEHMVHNEFSAYQARKEFEDTQRMHGAVWTFSRFGMTKTPLPSGATVYIAGEHEDFYDPDFHIYNDVIVRNPDGSTQFYIYPRDVFPPTDFHSATLVDDAIYIIGSLGYERDRKPEGATPVHRLDTKTYRIERVETTGESPRWISRHRAVLDDARGGILVSGGEVFLRKGHGGMPENFDEYRLDLAKAQWTRLTLRRWQQYRVHSTDDQWILSGKRWAKPEDFFTAGAHEVIPRPAPLDEDTPSDEWKTGRVRIDGVTVRYVLDLQEIMLFVEGELPPETVAKLVEELRLKLGKFLNAECLVERLR